MHLEKMYEENKEGILDVKAILNDNKMVDIEIQLENEYNMLKRTLYYWAGLYYMGLEEGQDYRENRKTVVISILDYNLFPEGKYHEKAYIIQESTGKRLMEDLELHYIQLRKSEKTETKLEQWIKFIRYEDEGGLKEVMEKNKVIEKANEKLEYLTGDEEIRRMAELKDRNDRAMKTHIAGERAEAREEGIKEGEINGIKKGKIEGIKEGEIKGIKKGKIERNKEIAREMKKNGFQNNIIATILKITEEEVEKLLK